LIFFTLTCLRQSPTNSVPCNPVSFVAQMYPTGDFLATPTAIGTHSRFTRQVLRYAQTGRFARTLFYDFPVTPEWMVRLLQRKAASSEAAFPALMASHWPPENLPIKEVELLADGLHRRSGVASFVRAGAYHDTLRTFVSVLRTNREQSKHQRHVALLQPNTPKRGARVQKRGDLPGTAPYFGRRAESASSH
jgi:hypothetical protein